MMLYQLLTMLCHTLLLSLKSFLVVHLSTDKCLLSEDLQESFFSLYLFFLTFWIVLSLSLLPYSCPAAVPLSPWHCFVGPMLLNSAVPCQF